MACAAKLRRGHVAHHQEAGDVHAEVAGLGDVLGGDVGLGAWVATRTEVTPRSWARSRLSIVPMPGSSSVVSRALLDDGRDRADPLGVGVRAGAVGQCRAGQPVAMRDLDRVDARGVQRGRDVGHLLEGVPVPHGVHAVPQRDVLDVDLWSDRRVGGHRATPAATPRSRRRAARQPLADPQRRRGHDVEVAGVGRQVVGGALDLEEHAHLGALGAGRDQGRVSVRTSRRAASR